MAWEVACWPWGIWGTGDLAAPRAVVQDVFFFLSFGKKHGPTYKLYLYSTWNLFVLYFGASTLQNKVFSNQNKGHLGFQVYNVYTCHSLLEV